MCKICYYGGSQSHIPYSYKLLRDVNFAIFTGNLNSTKIYSLKFISTCLIIYKIRPVILENKIMKMLNLWQPQNIHPSKICTSTVIASHPMVVIVYVNVLLMACCHL